MNHRHTVYLDPDTEKEVFELMDRLKVSKSAAVRMCIQIAVK